MLVEDVTGIPGYPIAVCSPNFILDAVHLHTIPYGGGRPFYLKRAALNITEQNARAMNEEYPSRNQVICFGQRQFNTVLIIPFEDYVSALYTVPVLQ
jgi:hypothetical protein